MGSKAIKVGDKVTQLIFLRGGRVFTSMIGRFDQQNRNKAQCWASKRHKAPKGPKVGQPFLGSKYQVARLCKSCGMPNLAKCDGSSKFMPSCFSFSRFEQDKSWATIPSPSVHDRHQSQMTHQISQSFVPFKDLYSTWKKNLKNRWQCYLRPPCPPDERSGSRASCISCRSGRASTCHQVTPSLQPVTQTVKIVLRNLTLPKNPFKTPQKKKKPSEHTDIVAFSCKMRSSSRCLKAPQLEIWAGNWEKDQSNLCRSSTMSCQSQTAIQEAI